MKRFPLTESRTMLPEMPSLPMMQLVTSGAQSVPVVLLTMGTKVKPSVEYVATSPLVPTPARIPAPAMSNSSNSCNVLGVALRSPLAAYHCRSTAVFGDPAQLVLHVAPSSRLTLLEKLVRPWRSEKNRLPLASVASSVSPPPAHVAGLPGPSDP